MFPIVLEGNEYNSTLKLDTIDFFTTILRANVSNLRNVPTSMQ